MTKTLLKSTIGYPSDTLFQSFLNSVIEPGTPASDPNTRKMPLSFRVPSGYIFSGDTFNNEKVLATWGLNIYDGACWEIALWLLKDNNASLLDEVRSSRKTSQFGSIIGNNVNSKVANKYLSPWKETSSNDPISRRSIVYPYDPNGFAFRMISNYYSYDPSTIYPQQWTATSKYWSDFRPICGENAWFYGHIPFIRNSHVANFKGYSGFNSTLFNMMDANINKCTRALIDIGKKQPWVAFC